MRQIKTENTKEFIVDHKKDILKDVLIAAHSGTVVGLSVYNHILVIPFENESGYLLSFYGDGYHVSTTPLFHSNDPIP